MIHVFRTDGSMSHHDAAVCFVDQSRALLVMADEKGNELETVPMAIVHKAMDTATMGLMEGMHQATGYSALHGNVLTVADLITLTEQRHRAETEGKVSGKWTVI